MSLQLQTKISIDKKLCLDRSLLSDRLRFMPSGNYMLILFRNDNERTKSDWQKFYRYILKEMSLDTGYDPKEMHIFAKDYVLLPKLELTSTTELDESSWPIYMEHLADWALDSFDFII